MPRSHWLRGEELLEDILRMLEHWQVNPMVVLKIDDPTPGMDLDDGELIGVKEVNSTDRRCSPVGGCIHWKHTGQDYGIGPFRAVFPHAFESHGRRELFLETKATDLPFQAMMKGLGLAHLQRPGFQWMEYDPLEASVTYTSDKATWNAARLLTEGCLQRLNLANAVSMELSAF